MKFLSKWLYFEYKQEMQDLQGNYNIKYILDKSLT